MKQRLAVRLFYESECSGGCCGCGPNQDVEAFEDLAKRLVEKFGEDNLTFEAYNSVDHKKFSFIKKDAKTKAPIVSVGEKVLSSGKLPMFSELQKEVEKQVEMT
jgi:hypothetical protein